MDVKFGTYNFLNGGLDDGDDTRLIRQLRRLARHQVTAWAFQECSWWDVNGSLEIAEELLGMRGYLARSTRSPGGNVAVFVRANDRIKVVGTRHEGMGHDEKAPFWHAVAVVHVDVPGFGPLRFGSGHLAPTSAELRAKEAEHIGHIAVRDGGPFTIGIDGNGYALNEPERDVEGMHPGKVRRKSDIKAALFLAEYMTDTGEYLGDTTPTVGHTRNDKLAYRCDRVHTTLPATTIVSHQVITADGPDSDHVEAITTFRLDTGD